jgi:antitoxin HigA-1
MPENREFPPPSVGTLLKSRILDDMKITQDELARCLGVSRFSVNQLLNGRRGLSAEMALRLAHVFGTTADIWLRIQTQVDIFEAKRRLGNQIEELPRIREPVNLPEELAIADPG